MNTKFLRISLIKNVLFATIFAIIYFGLQQFSQIEKTYVVIIAAVAAVLLSPRLKKTKTQDGEIIELYWLTKKVYEG